MATKNTILGTVPKSRGRYTEGDTTTKWYYDNILEYKGSSFRCISEASTGITGAPAIYNSGTHTLVPNAGWEFFVDTTGALDVEERLTENKNKLSELDEKIDGIGGEVNGVFIPLPTDIINGSLKGDGSITTDYGLCHAMLPVGRFVGGAITIKSTLDPFQFAFIKSYTSTQVVYCDGCTMESASGGVENKTIPQDAKYMYILCGNYTSPTIPTRISTTKDKEGLVDNMVVLQKENRKPYFINSKDENGRWQFEIFIPTSDGVHYIHTYLYHCVDSAINADNWRLYTAWLNDGVNDLYRIVNNGEWEMALQINGRPDFIGGSQHGDEKIRFLNVYVDGMKKDTPVDNRGTKIKFNHLAFIEVTDLYDPSNSAVKVAVHRKKYEITKDGIKLTQRIEWLGDYEMTYSYIAMLPVERKYHDVQVTDKWYDDLTYDSYDVSEPNFRGYPIQMKSNSRKQCLNGGVSGVSASVEILEQNPKIATSISFLSDSQYFNKMYFDFCGSSYNVSNGDVWTTCVLYKLDKATL